MYRDEVVQNFLTSLVRTKGFTEFYEEKYLESPPRDTQELLKMIEQFRLSRKSESNWSSDKELNYKILVEQLKLKSFSNSQSKISSLNEIYRINEEWIQEFNDELLKLVDTHRTFASNFREHRNVVFQKVDSNGLANLFNKYKNYRHPFVHYKVSNILSNSAYYSLAIPILEESVKQVASHPNYYWNSEVAVQGAALTLIDFLNLINRSKYDSKNLFDLKSRLLRLIYLYLSRSISTSNNAIFRIDAFSLRGWLTESYYYPEFVAIMGIGINPHVQAVSDFYMGYKACIDLGFVTGTFENDLYEESIRVYQTHLKDIEDKGHTDCVNVGYKRSIILSNNLLNSFENHELDITNDEISVACQFLLKNLPDDNKEFDSNLNIIGKIKPEISNVLENKNETEVHKDGTSFKLVKQGQLKGFSVYWLYDYYPKSRYKKVNNEVYEIRRLIYDFKDGRLNSLGKIKILKALEEVILSKIDIIEDMILTVIPASTKSKNQIRFYDFCQEVSSSYKIENGFNAINIDEDRQENKGRRVSNKVFNLSFDDKLLSNKIVLLVDDVTTTGESFIQVADELIKCGAKNVIGFFLGKTVPMNFS